MAISETNTGGLAYGPDGELADMPRDLAHQVSGDLGELLGLLQVINQSLDSDSVLEGYHSQESRLRSVLNIAGEKLQATINQLSPYV